MIYCEIANNNRNYSFKSSLLLAVRGGGGGGGGGGARYEKTCFMHMRKQRRRSAPLFSLHRYDNPSTLKIRNFKPLAIF